MNPQAQTYAKIAGVLLLLTIFAGGFGEAYAPSRLIVSGDPAKTAQNILASEWLFRLSFASYLVEALCDVTLSLLFYLLLRPVREDVALLSAFFGLVGTATFGFAELLYFSSALVLRDAAWLQTFSLEQRQTLAFLSLRAYSLGGGIFMAFYGLASILRGYLIFRSGFLPKFLGVLLMLGGLGFVVRNFTLVLAPAYASSLFLAPMFVAIAPLMLWLLIKGVAVAK